MRILVVDDDSFVSEIFKEELEHLGHTVMTATSGNIAISLLNAKTFDAVFSDVRMPDGDGLMLLRHALRFHPGLPVILISGFSDFSRQEAIDMGAFEFLNKPYPIAMLTKVLNNLAK